MELTSFKESINYIIDMQANQPERFNYRMGLKLEEVLTEPILTAVYGFQVEEWCLNPYGDVHGGVAASIMDTSMGIGAAALSQSNVNTTDIAVSFLSNMKGENSKYYVHCEYTKAGRKMIRCIARIKDGKTDKIYATAMGSFMVLGGELRMK